jgi:DNA-binding MarR family transcriptional regulator
VCGLGARLDLDSGTLTPLLRRLEAKRLIVRERSIRDERELFVRVTAAGAAMKRRACKVPLALIQNSPIPLTEIVSLRDQLKRVRDVLSAQDNAGALT